MWGDRPDGGPRSGARTSGTTARQESQALEQVYVLLILQQRAIERRDDQVLLVGAQRLGGEILYHQQLQPVEQFGRTWLLLQAGHFPDLEEDVERLARQVMTQVGVVRLDDALHRLAVGEADVVEEAAAQERVGQLL